MFLRKKSKRLHAPRAHHYVLAHEVIREICKSDPLQFFALMASPEQPKFLAWMWQEAERHAKQSAEDATLDEVLVNTRRIKQFPAVIITMPGTRAMAEAQMIAAVLTGDPTQEEPKPATRYFTLEDGENLDGSPRTVLCEWTDSGHSNYGDGPAPDVEAFAAAVERYL